MINVQLQTKNGYKLSFNCEDWTTNSNAKVVTFSHQGSNVVVVPIDNVEFMVTNNHKVNINKYEN